MFGKTRNTLAAAAFALVAVMLSFSPANAVVMLDQENDPVAVTAFFGIGQIGSVDQDVAQTFTVGKTGILDSFEVLVRRRTTATMRWNIVTTSSGVPTGTSLALGFVGESSIPALPFPGGAFLPIDVSAFNIGVTTGDVLAIVLEAIGGFHEFNGDGDTYVGGSGFNRFANITLT